jgi:hypothetical protein
MIKPGKIYKHRYFGYKVKVLEIVADKARCELVDNVPIMPTIPVILLKNLIEV